MGSSSVARGSTPNRASCGAARCQGLFRGALGAILALATVNCLGPSRSRGEESLVHVDPAAPPGDVRFTGLSEALAWARSRGGSEPLTIEVAPAVYAVAEPLRIGPLSFPLTLRATAPGARLVGGLEFESEGEPVAAGDPSRERLPEESRARIRVLDLTALTHREVRGLLTGLSPRGFGRAAAAVESELFCDGRPLTLARWPNGGLEVPAEILDPGSVPRNRELDIAPGERETGPDRGGALRVGDAGRARRWADARDLWAWGLWHHDWADELLPVADIDASSGVLRLGLPHRYGLDSKARFCVVNLPEELDAPGEYWIDRERAVAYVWPPDVLDARAVRARRWTVSILGDPMLCLDGATGVRIEGFTFEGSRGMAVSARGATDVKILHCEFRNLGSAAVALEGKGNTVEACVFEDVGASGVSLSGGDRATLTPGRNEVVDSVFRRCSRLQRTYQPAIRLTGVGQLAARNAISDLPHFAIAFEGNEHRIEGNDIARVVTETGDAGAVYAGRDWTLHGTVISGNLFRDIDGSDARYQNAVYLDDMASGIAVIDNVFLRCNWGILAGGGRDLTIERNVFLACRVGIRFDARGAGWMAPDLTDASTSTVRRRWSEMPVAREPWASRYPSLQSYLTDRMGRPVGSRVRDNLFLSTPFGSVDDRNCVRVESNVVADAAPTIGGWIFAVEEALADGSFGPRRDVKPGAGGRAPATAKTVSSSASKAGVNPP